MHSHKDHQILIVGGPNTRKTNPRWRTAAILKNRKSAISPERFDRSSPNLVRWCIFAERKFKFLTFRSTIIATISITFPDSTKYQMTRYDVTVSNFLWIADCCIMRTFIMRIICIFCFLKNTYVFLRILFYRTRILELWTFRWAKIRLQD